MLTSASEKTHGGKAQRLLELHAAGFRVPRFLVSPADVGQAVDELGTPLVVRSSACAEDGQRISFAGQFCSCLDLHTAQEVERAIEVCRQSVRAPSVREYCRRNGVDPQALRMEVIVQRMIQPELAGVAFTVNPITGADEVVIEACAGLSAELLAGRQAPLPPHHPLVRKYAGEIERMARAVQRHFGAPQDVEFAIQDGTLHVLQARPITRIGFGGELGEWTTADFRDGGVSSGVCTPLMWSLYEFVWDHALKSTLRQLKLFDGDFVAARQFFGRPYWNLGAVKRSVARLPGFVERDFDDDLSVRIAYDGQGHRTPVTPWRVVRAIPTLLATRKFFVQQEQVAQRLLGGEFERIIHPYRSIGSDVDEAFRRLIERDYLRIESDYFRTIFAASLAKLDLATSFPEAGDRALVGGLPPLGHMEPVRMVRDMTERSDDALAAVVERFRHHYRRGLDVRWPRWDEDQQFVVEMLRTMPRSTSGDPRPAYERALAEALARIPRWRRRSFRRKLDRLRTFVWLREEMRDLSSRMYHCIRRHALEIARRHDLGDDVFFMTFREIVALDRSNVERQREVYESYRNFQAPNEIGARYRCQRPAAGDALLGIGASSGIARGTARVARDVQAATGMASGEILVCPFTDPGWTPVLDRAGGVVTETGGLLSHAAVICREYGIPAVLGVEGATERIPDAAPLVLDGSLGLVEIARADVRKGAKP